MHDKKMKAIRLVIMFISLIVMIITVILQFCAFDLLRHLVLCGLILLLTTVVLIFDGKLKDRKNLFMHCAWFTLWLLNLINNLFRM